MTAISTLDGASEDRRAVRGAAFPFMGATLAILAVAIATQVGLGMLADVSWLISVNERWIGGEVPYQDFIDINPPASLMLYWPAVKAAMALGLRSELVVSAYGFGCIGVSLALCAAILRRAGLIESVGPVAYGFALIALAVLPGEAFCERDHLAAVFGLPFLALSVARCERGAIDPGLAALAGVGLGLMVAIKPPFALCAILPAPYLIARIGWRAWLSSIENYVGAALALAYVLTLPLTFPHYTSDIMRMGVEIYLPIRDGWLILMREGGSLLFFFFVLLGARVADKRLASPWIAVPALAGLGGYGAFVVQGKGWLYQALPMMIYLTIACGFALEVKARSRLSLALGMGAMIAAAFTMLFIRQLAVPVGVAALAATLIQTRLTKGSERFLEVFTNFALVATIGAAYGLDISERPLAPAISTALTRLGPHPTVVGLTEDMGFGHPMTRRVGARWAQHVPSLFITSAARKIREEHPGDAALAARMNTYLDLDKRMLLDDMRRRPDALLVGPLNSSIYHDLWADSELTAARVDYRLLVVNDNPDFPAELWVREDLIGLRDSLPGQPKR